MCVYHLLELELDKETESLDQIERQKQKNLLIFLFSPSTAPFKTCILIFCSNISSIFILNKPINQGSSTRFEKGMNHALYCTKQAFTLHDSDVTRRGSTAPQVSLLILMLGNLDEKSLALAAIFTATWRATAL